MHMLFFLTSFDFILQKANKTKELLFERVCKETERYRGKYLAFLPTGCSSRLILLFSFRFALTVSRLLQPVGG